MKTLFFLLFLPMLAWFTPCKGADIDYSSFQSVNEVIAFETSQILLANPGDPEALSEMYLSRGESYLLCRNNELALFDFQKGYEIANQCDHETKKALHFRALFGLAIVYGCEEMRDELYTAVNALQTILASYECYSHQDTRRQTSLASLAHLHSNKPIIGPERIPIENCVNFAVGTAKQCRILIDLVPKIEWRITLNILINDLEGRAIRCCQAGGIWKACLQPIVNKWQLWNEKWNVFRTPPDPAWD